MSSNHTTSRQGTMRTTEDAMSAKGTTGEGGQGRGSAGRDYRRLAPSVDESWLEAFVLEQRLRGVPGDRIGDALAVVESHVAESGEGAREAFGDPKEYARSLTENRPGEGLDRGFAAGLGLALLGMLVTLAGVQAWIAGDPAVELTAGWLATVVVVLAVLGLMIARSEAVLRLLTSRLWVTALSVAGVVAVLVALTATLDGTVATLGVVPVTVTGVVLLLVGSGLELRHLGTPSAEDPILGPGESAPQRRVSPSGVAVALLMPALTVLMVGFVWLLETLA